MKHVYGNCCLRLDFSFFNQNYMLMKKIILFVSFLSTFTIATAQNRTITGQVVDDKGSGIANASVVVKGTSVGTVTNVNGSFSLSVPSNARALIVSYIGMGEKEIALTNNSTYNVGLSATKSDLQEVVVVGYGTQKRASVTASQTTVKAPKLRIVLYFGRPNVERKGPGLQAPQFSGQPGAAQNIRIRASVQ
jgi:hypothetical protein